MQEMGNILVTLRKHKFPKIMLHSLRYIEYKYPARGELIKNICFYPNNEVVICFYKQ